MNGKMFLPDSVVRWNGASRATTYISDTELTAAIPSADVAETGFVTIDVFNAPPGGGPSNALTFIVDEPNPLPALSAISPSIVDLGGPEFTLTVTGTGFVETSVVRWRGRDRSTRFISDTELRASIPASDIAVSRGSRITVFSPPPGGGLSNALGVGIRITGPEETRISFINPSIAALGQEGFTLVITGQGFTTSSVVRWNGEDRPTTSSVTRRNELELEASIPASDLGAPGLAEISVYTPPPGRGISNVVLFPVYLEVATNDLIYDKARKIIYASVPADAGITGNSIRTIDPLTGAIGPPVFVGPEPTKLAVSDDGRYLYVVLQGVGAQRVTGWWGAASVRRLELPSLTPELEFSLSDGSDSLISVQDIEVLPGKPESVAVARRIAGVFGTPVAIFDNGVKRPVETPRLVQSDLIEFSATDSVLYGMKLGSGDGDFTRMVLDDSGVVGANTVRVEELFGNMQFEQGFIYIGSGLVIDPEALRVEGRFSLERRFGLVFSDSATGRVFFLHPVSAGRTPLVAFDRNKFDLTGRLDIPGVASSPSSLLRWGEDGFAFGTFGQSQVCGTSRPCYQVFLFRAPSLVAPFLFPNFRSEGAVNGASFAAKVPVTPGSIVSLFGTDLASSSALAPALPLPTSLGGISLEVNGLAAPLIFVSPQQINFQLPWELSGQNLGSLAIAVNDLIIGPTDIPLRTFGPGIFSVNSAGSGQGCQGQS